MLSGTRPFPMNSEGNSSYKTVHAHGGGGSYQKAEFSVFACL